MGSIKTEEGKDGSLIIKPEGALSAYEVAAVKDQMLIGLKNFKGLVVDVSGITNCDTLGIQLLYSAGKTARDSDKAFSITGKSDACREAAAGIGLEPEDYLISIQEA